MENEEGIKMEKTVNVFTENNIQIGTISEAQHREIISSTRKDIKLHIYQLLMNAKTATNFFIFCLKMTFVAILAMLVSGYSAGDKEMVSAVLSVKSILVNGYSDLDMKTISVISEPLLKTMAKMISGTVYVALLFFGILTYGEVRNLFVFNEQKKAIRNDYFFFHRSLYLDRVGLEIKILLQEPYNGPVWVAYEN